MADEFDREMETLGTKRRGAKAAAGGRQSTAQLSALKNELESSDGAKKARLVVESTRDTLRVSIKGQPIGEWRADSSGLALYRAGSASADTYATSVSEAVKMTARLVAAAGQA